MWVGWNGNPELGHLQNKLETWILLFILWTWDMNRSLVRTRKKTNDAVSDLMAKRSPARQGTMCDKTMGPRGQSSLECSEGESWMSREGVDARLGWDLGLMPLPLLFWTAQPRNPLCKFQIPSSVPSLFVKLITCNTSQDHWGSF